MYLILMVGHKDIAKVWQEGDVIKVQAFDRKLQKKIEEMVREAKGRIKDWNRWGEEQANKEGRRRERPPISYLERIGYALEPGTALSPKPLEIKGERIWVDCVDEKTGDRWDISIGIIKDKKYKEPNRIK
jgi:hypothetical protein